MPAAVPVPIDLKDGQARSLKFTSGAMIRFEERFVPFPQLLREGLSIRFVIGLVWAGLLWENPRLTLEDVAGLFDRYSEEGGTWDDFGDLVMTTLLAHHVVKQKNGAGGGEPPPNP